MMKKCLRWNRIELLKYLQGDPLFQNRASIETHLQTCNQCRETLEQLKRGDRFARMIPDPSSTPDIWSRIEQQINASSRRSGWSKPRALPAIAVSIVIVSIVAVAWSIAKTNTNSIFSSQDRIYKKVAISKMGENTEPHIVTEGFVSEVAVDDDGGDYKIKLKENLKQAGPFVVCEILRPSKIALPAVGKRVRVYGVSRYDGKPGHEWHEVHPVFDIEPVQ